MAKKPRQEDIPTQRRAPVKRRAPRQEDVPTQIRPAVARRTPRPRDTGPLAPLTNLVADQPLLRWRSSDEVKGSDGKDVFGYVVSVDDDELFRVALLEGGLLNLIIDRAVWEFEHHLEIVVGREICAFLVVQPDLITVTDVDEQPLFAIHREDWMPVEDLSSHQPVLHLRGRAELDMQPILRDGTTIGWVHWEDLHRQRQRYLRRQKCMVKYDEGTPLERLLGVLGNIGLHGHELETLDRRRRQSRVGFNLLGDF